MASQKNFANVPSVSITRSKFLRPSQEKTTLKCGEITPIYLEEVIPGSTHSLTMASLIRMATPIVPIMDNIHIDYYAFFCPMRILWDHWKEFNGENTSGAGATDPVDYEVPYCDLSQTGNEPVLGSLGDHLGLPLITANEDYELKVSDLPGRAYWLIYNEWFRDQNVESPKVIGLSDIGNEFYSGNLAIAYKDSDYFTRSLPYAQKGDSVTIPLGTLAPVGFIQESTTAFSDVMLDTSGVTTAGDFAQAYKSDGDSEDLVADLSNATASTINALRFAFQYQKFLERDALYGTRYWEILKGHFGVEAPDASLQRPENLGHIRTNISIDQVLQTSATSDEGGTPLGNPGANSVTGSKYQNLFTKSFTEAGYIMVLAVVRHDQTYSQGVDRMWTRKVRYDFYDPLFANLGAQAVLNKEIYAEPSADLDKVFGYQEAWAEYRYKSNKVTGALRPSIGDSMGAWTLANNFAALPTLGTTFLKQGRENLTRALVTGAGSDFDFICDFSFIDTAVLPMPMYSIPGLIDHH